MLYYEEIGKNLHIIMQLYPFINKYNWYGINVALEKDDLAKFEKLNSRIALNVLYQKEKEIKKSPAYI